VPLTGEGLAWLDCASENACVHREFSPETGTCVDTPVAEGTPCVDATGCLTDTVCVAGACRGQLLECDDGNPCTSDFCAPQQGCQHVTATSVCASDDPCEVPSCDPVLGCQVTPAPDGTSCGVTVACRSAGVCLSGKCQELVAPEGTACSLDWAPCADDARCQQGECFSPTASRWTPGQVLWRYEADGGANTSLEVHAVDDAGNSYLSQWGPEQLLSLDACGRTRWAQPLGGYAYGLMLEGAHLYSQEAGQLVGRSAVSGQSQWVFDVAQALGFCDGGPCGASLQGNLYAAPAVLSKQGKILLSGVSPGPPWDLQVLAVSTGGHLAWRTSLGDVLATVGGANAVADTQGNLYTFVSNGFSVRPADSALVVVDPQGTLEAQVPAYIERDLAVGSNFVLDLGGNPATAWSPTGAQLFSVASQISPSTAFQSAAAIGAHGEIIFAPGFAMNPTTGQYLALTRLDATGQQRATVPGNGMALSEVSLDEAGNAYVLMETYLPEHFHLLQWDGVSPTFSLDVDLGPSTVTTSAGTSSVYARPSIFITHGMAIIEVGDVVQAVFIGHQGAATGASWPRGFGGTNENRHSP
jgi:hypothetical protein